MSPHLTISRRTAAVVLFGLGTVVVGLTAHWQRRSGRSTHEPARRLLQERLLAVVDQALRPLEQDAEDSAAFQAAAAPAAAGLVHREAVLRYYLGGNVGAGVARYRQLLARYPDDAGLLYGLGALLVYAGHTRSARPVLARALTLDPLLWPARLSLAAAAALEGQPELSLRLCTEQLGLFSDAESSGLAAAYGNTALHAALLGRTAEALEYCNRALSLRRRMPAHGLAAVELAQDLALRAKLYLALDDNAEALEDLAEALDLAQRSGARALQCHILFAQLRARRRLGHAAAALTLEHRVGERIEAFTDPERLRRALAGPVSAVPASSPAG
jgi:tetratricopeptide (TPR) repeat protein